MRLFVFLAIAVLAFGKFGFLSGTSFGEVDKLGTVRIRQFVHSIFRFFDDI